MEKHRRPGNSFFPKQPERRIAMGRELRIQLGENKEDKYGNRWEPKTVCVHRSTQREEQKEGEREIEGGRERSRGGEGERERAARERTAMVRN